MFSQFVRFCNDGKYYKPNGLSITVSDSMISSNKGISFDVRTLKKNNQIHHVLAPRFFICLHLFIKYPA